MGTSHPSSGSDPEAIFDAIRAYWNEYIHDAEVAEHPVGTKEFFQELDACRFQKLRYLTQVVNFTALKEKRLLEVGCGIGTELARFANQGAIVTGIDLAERPIELAKEQFALIGVAADLRIMNGEDLLFNEASFDIVYAKMPLQYTPDPAGMIREIYRVLKPRGEAIFVVFNRYSWLNLLSKVSGKKLLHEDAPVFRTYSIGGFRKLLSNFSQIEITTEVFPKRTGAHNGLTISIYNALIPGMFSLSPRAIVRPFGAHIVAKAIK